MFTPLSPLSLPSLFPSPSPYPSPYDPDEDADQIRVSCITTRKILVSGYLEMTLFVSVAGIVSIPPVYRVAR